MKWHSTSRHNLTEVLVRRVLLAETFKASMAFKSCKQRKPILLPTAANVGNVGLQRWIYQYHILSNYSSPVSQRFIHGSKSVSRRYLILFAQNITRVLKVLRRVSLISFRVSRGKCLRFPLSMHEWFPDTLGSKKICNDQELIQSDSTSCPQNQKGNN